MSAFLASDLGKIYQAIPWSALVKAFGLRSKPMGRKSYFSPQGKLALMFLKHYSGCSDKRLVEQLNGNLHYQFFCGMLLRPGEGLLDSKIASKIRCELARCLSIEKAQEVLASYWKPHLANTTHLLVDATCYESSVRYPTDIKLLWEAVNWSHGQMRALCRQLGLVVFRSKYAKWAMRYMHYRRKRNPRKKDTRSISRGLLRLLLKLDGLLDELEADHEWEKTPTYRSRRQLIKKVYAQQWFKFTTGQSPKDRIISLSKGYLRPIVRGKEVKAVEFGAKVNKIQIDGINFIEKLDFEAFHEGKRLEQSVYLARKYVGKVALLGADAIYATNANRRYCRKENIRTDFKRKGRAGKFEDQRKQLAQAITKARTSSMEGSFGTEKQHYLLHKILARTQQNEVLWIFIGIHTANALKIGRRMAQQASAKAA